MITLSKPISSGQAQAYHKEEFANARENYYTEGERVRGEWQGQHPETGEQLVRHQTAREYVNASGETVRTMEHRAGWDATFSAPKSVSLTALVGGDDRVRDAHRESVKVALDEMEKYAQARMGGNVPAQTTGQWAVAKFEHDSSRPVNGYAAPQLHTHAVAFNVTETADGQTPSGAAAGTLQNAAVRDGGVSLGTGGAVAGAWLRNRTRRARAAGDQGLRTRVFGGFESAAAANRRAYGKGRSARGWRRADRGASDARCQAAVIA